MVDITDKDAIVVDEKSVDSDDLDYDIVQSNIDFINARAGSANLNGSLSGVSA